MKLKTALIITLFSPMASHAFMGTPMPMNASGIAIEDCGNRVNDLGSQMADIQSMVHRVALIGEESGRPVSSDPNTQEARNAEAVGQSVTCGRSSGALNLVEFEGRTVLIGPAHTFYENGELKCDNGFGEFYPDDHYFQNPNSGVTFNRGYRFKLPPLNDETAYKGIIEGSSPSDRLRDFVILEIEDESVLERQAGGERATIQMDRASTSELSALSNRENISLVSSRDNFHNRREVSYENNCQILNIAGSSSLKSHTCDTGNGTSGSSLNYTTPSGQLRSVGIHYGSDGGRNFLIPSENIIDTLEDLYPSENTVPIADGSFSI